MRRFLLLSLATLWAFAALGQQRTVTGVVTSAEDGNPLPQLSVMLKGSTPTGVVTDPDGRYRIQVPGPEAVLQFVYMGMATQEITVGDRTELNVVMQPGDVAIDQAVVVGYGTVRKSELTGAVASVDKEKLQNVPVTDMVQAMQGKIAGVQVLSTNGRAGSDMQISIRGTGSLSASQKPLYVIDGVPMSSMSSVAPEDVQSIEILKDAASAAIYGSRASNGVVLITTKRGEYTGNGHITVNSTFGIQQPVKLPKLLNAAEYKMIHDVARANYMADIASGLERAPRNPKILDPLPDPKYDINYMKLVLRSFSKYHSHTVNMDGGNESTRYFISGNFMQQEGIVKLDEFQRFRMRSNVDHKFNRYLKVGLNANGRIVHGVGVAGDNNVYSPWSAAMNARPDTNPYDDEGKVYPTPGFTNPLGAFQRDNSTDTKALNGTFNFEVTPIEGLVWHSTYTGGFSTQSFHNFDPPSSLRGTVNKIPKGFAVYMTDIQMIYQLENTVNYSGIAFDDKFSYTALVGHSFYKSMLEHSEVGGEGFSTDDIKWLDAAGKITGGGSNRSSSALESYFSRLQLGWDRKYNLMLSIRADGTSRFAKKNRWGVFPAASAGWNLHEEEFMKFGWLNELKVRVSYGLTGNQAGISTNLAQDLLAGGYNQGGRAGLAARRLYNPNLHWEKGHSANIGIDFSALDNRIDFSVDLYHKITTDLLYAINVPQESGYTTMASNDGGKIRNRGVEVSVNGVPYQSEDRKIRWTVSANFTYNENRVLELGNKKGYYTTGFASIVKQGHPLGSFYLLEALGIAKEPYYYSSYVDENGRVQQKVVQPGDVIYRDVNGDGKIDDNDNVLFRGGVAPIFGGFSTALDCYGFDLSLNFQYAIGRKIYAMYREDQRTGAPKGGPSYSHNMDKGQLDYWSPSNPNAKNPRPYLNGTAATWNNLRSSRNLEKGDYLRCQDITLGYTFTKTFKIPYIQQLRLYAQVRNAFTVTPYTGLDPEGQNDTDPVYAGFDQHGIPNMRVYAVGLNIKF